MMEFLGVGIAIAVLACVSFLPLVLLGLAVPYLVIRLKAESPPDPQLGAKIVFQFFFSAAMLVALAGTTMFAVDWLTRDYIPNEETGNPLGRSTFESLSAKGFNVTQRIGLGMILSGGAVAALHALLIHSTTLTHRQRIRRTFIGWRFAIHGVIVLFGLTLLLTLVLQREPFQMPIVLPLKAVTAATLVWAISWVVHLLMLFDASRSAARADAALAGGNAEAPPQATTRQDFLPLTIAPPAEIPLTAQAMTEHVIEPETHDDLEIVPDEPEDFYVPIVPRSPSPDDDLDIALGANDEAEERSSTDSESTAGPSQAV